MRVISGSARGTKLNSIDDISTRPTLDRVKESLFNIINSKIEDSTILDLFAGSGAIGIEFLSRGCKKAYFCDKSSKAVEMININLEKTKLAQNAVVMNKDYIQCLNSLKSQKIDIIFIDPPYKANIAVEAIKLFLSLKLLNEDGIIIVETDELERELENFKKLDIEIYDCRKYGRANLIFLS